MDRMLLVRHAVTAGTGSVLSGWTSGLDLSDEGREQARSLAGRLAALPLDAVCSSPLERCMQTAAALAEPRGLKVEVVEELGEVRYGDWTGRRLDELAKEELWRTVQHLPSAALHHRPRYKPHRSRRSDPRPVCPESAIHHQQPHRGKQQREPGEEG